MPNRLSPKSFTLQYRLFFDTLLSSDVTYTHGNVHSVHTAVVKPYRRLAYLHRPACDRNVMPEDGALRSERAPPLENVLLLLIVVSYVRLMLEDALFASSAPLYSGIRGA